MHLIKSMWLFLFSRDRFLHLAIEHAVEYQLLQSPELRDPLTGSLPADRRANIETTIRGQVDTMRRGIYTGIGITAGTIVVGVAVDLGLRAALPPAKWLVYLLQGAGAAVILGATLAEVGRDIETYDRTTLPEQVNAFTFRALYVLGTFLFVTSVAWDA